MIKPRRPYLNLASPYGRHVLAAWMAYEGAGTLLRDISGHRHHAIVSADKWGQGDNGPYFNVNGSGTAPAGNWAPTGAFSIVSRAKTSSSSQIQTLLAKKSSVSGGATGWQFGTWKATGRLGFTNRVSGVDAPYFNGETVINDGDYHTLAVSYDGTIYRLYVDGELDGSAAGADLGINTVDINLGSINNTYQWGGGIDYIFVYDYPLNPRQMRSMHANPFAAVARPQLVVIGAVIPGTTSITLSWQDNSEHEDGFVIERAMDGGAFSEIDTVAAGTESYIDSVETGHTYTYRVRATSAALGDSEYSNEAEITV